MNRRNFLSLTGTYTGGLLVLPQFLYAFGSQRMELSTESCILFIQLNGGNDGLNTFIPYENPLYYAMRPNIAISKDQIIGKNKGMGFHPALKDFGTLQQKGLLSILQNVGYPEPNRSHFRSQEIWQTASGAQQYINEGWLGRFLDLQCTSNQPTAAVNIDNIDNLALKGSDPHCITLKDPGRFKVKSENTTETKLSDNPQLDFVRKIAHSIQEGSEEIQKALENSTDEKTYPKTGLGKNLQWMGRLIKGNLNSKIYYTSLSGFDTHDNQLTIQNNKLTELNDAVYAFCEDMIQANLLSNVTVVIFSEFGRRVQDNGKGTDHGTAAPVFVIGGKNQGKVIGTNPDLENLDQGDLKFQIDFRSLYANLLTSKFNFDPSQIGISQPALNGLF